MEAIPIAAANEPHARANHEMNVLRVTGSCFFTGAAGAVRFLRGLNCVRHLSFLMLYGGFVSEKYLRKNQNSIIRNSTMLVNVFAGKKQPPRHKKSRRTQNGM